MFPLRPLLFGLLSLPAAALSPPTDLIYGHYEIQVDYTATPGDPDAGWHFSVSYDEDDDFSTTGGVVRLDPETTVIVAGPNGATAVPSPAGVFSRFGPPGTPLWVLPQNNAVGVPFLGVRTTMAAGLFQARVGNNYSPSAQGSISLRLVSAAGTGPDSGGNFATWKSESFGSTVFSFDTTDGISSADEIPTIPVSSHTHYNWGLTRPGTYQLTFEAKGKLMPAHGNAITTAQKTFTFVVPFSSRIGGGAEIRAIESESGELSLTVADPAARVAYAPDRAMLEATTPSTLPGAAWELPITLSTTPSILPNGVGLAPDLVSAGLDPAEWSGLTWTLTEIRGPGTFSLRENDDILAANAGDSIPLTADTTRNIVATFSTTGLYRITGIIQGQRSGVATTSPPVTLVFGAGLTASHDYAAWQASFEQTAGLATGSLGNPEADHDHDGIANGVEFAFFWQGLDPARPDADKMPNPFATAEGFGAIDFLRDTYKDPLDESSWKIRASHSPDLTTWEVRSPRVPGFPLGLFETGAESGNARGRILRRYLRVMPASQPRAYFRFDVSPP